MEGVHHPTALVRARLAVQAQVVEALLPASGVLGPAAGARRGRALEHVLEHFERLETLREEEHLLVGGDGLLDTSHRSEERRV